MITLLITGCNGFLGQKIAKNACSNWRILGVDLHESAFNPNIQYRQFDITLKEAVSRLIEETKPDWVINTASVTDVDRCEAEKKLAWEVNVRGVENITSVCSKLDCKVIHISTDYIFDGMRGPYSEGDLPSPCNFYGETKWEGEKVLERFPLDYAIVRTSALYGLCRRGKKKFFDLLLDSLSKKKEIHGFVDQFTTPTYVGDLVEGIKKVMDKEGLFHISGGEFLSRFDFARKVAKVFGYDPSLIRPKESTRAGLVALRPLKGGLRIDRAQGVLGYRPHSIEKALEIIRMEREQNAAEE